MNAIAAPAHQPPMSACLQAALEVSKELEADQITIHTAFDNGRRIVFLVDRPPNFVIGAVRGRHPNGQGGVTTVHAAPYRGCQLEWHQDSAPLREVAHA